MDDLIKKLGEKYEKYFDYLNQKMITEQIIKRGINNPKIIDAIKTTPRHLFLPDNLKTRAYDDCAVEILPGQTISQPYIVALMIDLLKLEETHKVLEIGTATGWQTCILSKLTGEVYSIDIRKNLYNFAAERIQKYSKGNVFLKIANGAYGWEENAPYDRIIVSCAAERIPQALLQQLSTAGIMVIPIGGERYQTLKIIEKKSENNIEIKDSIDVVFVRMEDDKN